MDMNTKFKTSEVGKIPADWKVEKLIGAVNIAKGQIDPKKEPYKSMVLVAPDHIESGTGKLLAKVTAAEQKAISGKYPFLNGDIIYSKIRPYLRKAILADFDGLCSADMYPLKTAAGVSAGYVFALILDSRFSRFAESVSVRSGMPKINRAELAEFSIPLPPEPEQRAIAAALSNADALIAALDALIAKKRDLKQAAMQQLLTGKTRLPGFKGEWKRTRIGALGHFAKGAGIRRDQTMSGHLPCVRYGEIYTTHDNVVRDFKSYISRTVAETATRIEYGDILFAGSGETKEEIGKCVATVNKTEAYAGGDIIILRPRACDPVFLGYFLNSRSVQKQKANYGQGDAVVHISSASLARIEISIPDEDEQFAIAEVLSDIDDEIFALEARRDKARAIKQGMMQELLTGRIRLV